MSGLGNASRIDGVRGNPKPPPEIVMAAYDDLPAIVRRAVANSAFDFDVTAILRNLRAGYVTPKQAVELIEEFERKHVSDTA